MLAFTPSPFTLCAFTQETHAMKKKVLFASVSSFVSRSLPCVLHLCSTRSKAKQSKEEEKAVPLYAFSKIDVVLMAFWSERAIGSADRKESQLNCKKNESIKKTYYCQLDAETHHSVMPCKYTLRPFSCSRLLFSTPAASKYLPLIIMHIITVTLHKNSIVFVIVN